MLCCVGCVVLCWCCVVLCCVGCVALCCVVLCYEVLCCVVLCCVVLVVLWFCVQWNKRAVRWQDLSVTAELGVCHCSRLPGKVDNQTDRGNTRLSQR